ncbi:2-keto-4-pentenoate hydratase [Schinkia azotoformans]|uniref:2-keto-4-pentenoate hydratase n=1 Tax=Schinkia azotoformans TaxID=1454 RepID=UPI00054ED8F5|nr:2-keto-4-pentenoate hydratase [Schinkia azotoformans]MEC1638856.1 2-keto-4-pentenoate hydratase [Schinkia azotoformans]MEC1697824.1 2-keto-4-pentenoate hydratase [Schinkia azotoformans]MEC1715979.1 2-keto-4-pentenoate hydratase [Schinkia azotoformans]MEC1720882.1 2-keto-4-pentenoate hydratase [Schinkia azotoformans]MEC1726238.1 2-keto-4-pentenoate hydratase [Schinkia azotoformans]
MEWNILTTQTIQFADQLREAEVTGVGIAPLTSVNPDLTPVEAYHIQLENIQRKLDAGQKVVGKKIGLTSLAMQKLLGVDEPDYGHLLDSMVVENGGTVSMSQILQPRVEGEIAFILKKDLIGPNVTTLDVLQATKYIVPALEIVGSRVKDWKIKLPDTIADNASSGLYVLGGKPTRIEDVNLELLGMVLTKNGQLVNTGVGAAALGNPATCVAWLANKLSQFDIPLRAGEVILSGALSAMVVAEPGDTFTARFAHLGQVTVNFEE